jgi:hypothetical protein
MSYQVANSHVCFEGAYFLYFLDQQISEDFGRALLISGLEFRIYRNSSQRKLTIFLTPGDGGSTFLLKVRNHLPVNAV